MIKDSRARSGTLRTHNGAIVILLHYSKGTEIVFSSKQRCDFKETRFECFHINLAVTTQSNFRYGPREKNIRVSNILVRYDTKRVHVTLTSYGRTSMELMFRFNMWCVFVPVFVIIEFVFKHGFSSDFLAV